MTQYVAFLRAINVGGHTVKMDHLRTLFEELEFTNVATFIASGNVIFEASAKPAALETKISAHLKDSLGYAVDSFVRSLTEVAEIQKRCPFEVGKKDQDLYVGFLHATPQKAAQASLMSMRNKLNDFAILDREVYWSRLNKDDSIFLKNSLEKILNMSATVRGLPTLGKLLAKHS